MHVARADEVRLPSPLPRRLLPVLTFVSLPQRIAASSLTPEERLLARCDVRWSLLNPFVLPSFLFTLPS